MKNRILKLFLLTTVLSGATENCSAMKGFSLWGTSEEKPAAPRLPRAEVVEEKKPCEASLQTKTTNHTISTNGPIYPKAAEEIIEGFKFENLTFLTVLGSDYTTQDMVSFLEQNCPSLVFLNLSGSKALDYFGKWLVGYVQQQVNFPNLCNLRLDDCSNLSSVALSARALTVFSTRNNTSLKRMSLDTPELTEVCLDGSTALTDEALDQSLTTCKKLVNLSTSGCTGLRNPRVRSQFVMLSDPARKLFQPEVLDDLCEKSIAGQAFQVSALHTYISRYMAAELCQMPHLTGVTLYKVDIGNEGVRHLLTHPTLQFLHVMGNQRLTVIGHFDSAFGSLVGSYAGVYLTPYSNSFA